MISEKILPLENIFNNVYINPKPDINKLNYTETKIKSFIDSFIIRNIEDNEKPYLKDKYEKYSHKVK